MMPVDRRVRRAYKDLIGSQTNIHDEFAKLRDSVYRCYLGSLYDQLHRHVREFCDGHVLYGLPSTIRGLRPPGALVIFAATSPKLSDSSNFNPVAPLHEIRYWSEDKGITPLVRSESETLYKVHYMAWQQNFAIHGVCDAHARRNRKLLVEARPILASLFEQECQASICFLKAYIDWLIAKDTPIFLVTQYNRTRFREPISALVNRPPIIHLKAKLRGKNRTIMCSIAKRLP